MSNPEVWGMRKSSSINVGAGQVLDQVAECFK